MQEQCGFERADHAGGRCREDWTAVVDGTPAHPGRHQQGQCKGREERDDVGVSRRGKPGDVLHARRGRQDIRPGRCAHPEHAQAVDSERADGIATATRRKKQMRPGETEQGQHQKEVRPELQSSPADEQHTAPRGAGFDGRGVTERHRACAEDGEGIRSRVHAALHLRKGQPDQRARPEPCPASCEDIRRCSAEHGRDRGRDNRREAEGDFRGAKRRGARPRHEVVERRLPLERRDSGRQNHADPPGRTTRWSTHPAIDCFRGRRGGGTVRAPPRRRATIGPRVGTMA